MARRTSDESPSPAAAAAMAAKAISDTTTAVMGNDIAYIKRDIADIKAGFTDLTAKYVTKADFEQANKDATIVHDDHETRLRSTEKTQTQVVTWGSVALILLGVFEFLVVHFVK